MMQDSMFSSEIFRSTTLPDGEYILKVVSANTRRTSRGGETVYIESETSDGRMISQYFVIQSAPLSSSEAHVLSARERSISARKKFLYQVAACLYKEGEAEIRLRSLSQLVGSRFSVTVTDGTVRNHRSLSGWYSAVIVKRTRVTVEGLTYE